MNLNPFREAAAKAVPTIEEFTEKHTKVLLALNALAGQQLYAGTANPKSVAKRRAKNKVAKRSRRANRP